MAYQIQEGEILTYTTTGAVSNGELKVLNNLAGVALESATGSGKVISLAVEGVFDLAAVATGVKTRGLKVGYRTTGSQLKVSAVAAACTGAAWATTGSTLAGGRYCIGTVWETANAAATSMKVKLIGGPMVPLV